MITWRMLGIVADDYAPLHDKTGHTLDKKHKFYMTDGGKVTNTEQNLELAQHVIKVRSSLQST